MTDTMDNRLKEVLGDKCDLEFPAEYYDCVSPDDFREVFRAGIREVVERIDVEFILNCLKQSKGMIWQRRGRGICTTQIKKLETLQAKLQEWGLHT